MNPVLSVEDVRLRRGARTVLDGITFSVTRGELVSVMGPSGCGKTTVLRAIVGLEAFDGGRISVDGVTLTPGALPGVEAMKHLCRKVGMVFQFHCLFEHLTVMDNICLAPVHVQGIARADAEARAHALLTSFGVDHRASALPRQLSGGEAQRVAIARALAVDPPVLLMDEPTASLDPERRNELGALLTDLCRQGRSLVVVTHDDDFAHDFSTRVLRVRNGVVLPQASA